MKILVGKLKLLQSKQLQLFQQINHCQNKMNVNRFSEDLIGLKEFATELEDFIKVEKGFVEGSLVISLNAPFGSGKTTFLKMWKNEIKNQSPKDSQPILVDLNAWESDYYGDPLFAIILRRWVLQIDLK